MPTLPATDGLPVWAQILVSILVCLATLAVAFKGYFGNDKRTPARVTESTQAVSLSAILGDLGAIRHLSDTVVQLNVSVIALTNVLNEGTHWNRNEVEIMREICQRLRELTEELERQGTDARRWDKRDEGRR